MTGTTIGKGFAGTIKRHHFSSQRASHGNSRSHRVPGSIGQAQGWVTAKHYPYAPDAGTWMCLSALDTAGIGAWPQVRAVQRRDAAIEIVTDAAEAVVRRLLTLYDAHLQ